MAIEVISIGSSSSGNSYLIMAGKHNIILDVGLAAKRIVAALEKFNVSPEEVDAVLVTHEHVDHVRSVRAIGRKCKNAVFITSRGTAENTENFKYIPAERLMIAASGDRIYLTEGALTEEASKKYIEVSEGFSEKVIYCDRLQNENRIQSGKFAVQSGINAVVYATGSFKDNADSKVAEHKEVYSAECIKAESEDSSDAFTKDRTESPAINPGDLADCPAAYPDSIEKYSENYNNITISAFAISHDAAEPLSYTIEYAGEKLAIVTDTGIVTDSIYEAIHDADILVFESNHDEDLLMFGEYPYPLKMRIKGDYGHLSNRYAGELLSKLLTDRASFRPVNPAADPEANPAADPKANTAADPETNPAAGNKQPLHIMLAHLSFHNNAPFYARTTVEETLQKNGFEKGRDYTLTIAARDELTLFD